MPPITYADISVKTTAKDIIEALNGNDYQYFDLGNIPWEQLKFTLIDLTEALRDAGYFSFTTQANGVNLFIGKSLTSCWAAYCNRMHDVYIRVYGEDKMKVEHDLRQCKDTLEKQAAKEGRGQILLLPGWLF